MKSQIDSSFMLGNNDDVREIMAEKMYMMDNSNDAAKAFLQQHSSVSYTHLTLPTIA